MSTKPQQSSHAAAANAAASGGTSVAMLVGIGLAVWASHTLGNPVGWIAIHAFFNWFYLLYLCAGCGGGLPDGLF